MTTWQTLRSLILASARILNFLPVEVSPLYPPTGRVGLSGPGRAYDQPRIKGTLPGRYRVRPSPREGDVDRKGRKVFGTSLMIVVLFPTLASGQILDSLDAYPPRFFLDTSDCDARVIRHENTLSGGVDGGACELVTLKATHGSEALLVYPIEPMRPIDDLNATLSVMSAVEGASIGFRVRFPFLKDPETRRPVSVIVYGASYRSPGEFASIGIGSIERPLRMKWVALRSQYGPSADLSDAYVDAVVINAYGGPGISSIRLDQLKVSGLIPVGEGIVTGNARSSDTKRNVSRRMSSGQLEDFPVEPSETTTAFPVGRVTRILQHNGEPLAWIRTLGFDAVLIRQPPDAAILAEAVRTRMKIYAPPPPSPDPLLDAMLEPIAGWYIGAGEALDERQIDAAKQTVARLRGLPSRWQRPIMAAPSDSYRRYASLVDAIIDDLPPRGRSVRAGEEIAEMAGRRRWINDRAQLATGVASMPPEAMLIQTEAIARAIGAPPPSSFRWHSMWLQTMRSLYQMPSAILYRSTRSLASGSEMDQIRSLSLSYVNRMIAMLEPWLIAATQSPAPSIQGAPYQCTCLTTEGTDLLILTSTATRGSEVLAGDGASLTVSLEPSQMTKSAWRMTHFSAERLTPVSTDLGASIEIVSPDVVEIIVLSSDPSVGGQLAQQASRFAQQASLDRWQLANTAVTAARHGWDQATAMRAVGSSQSTNLIGAAEQTLAQAQPMHSSGDIDGSLRMAARADAWALRSEWQLAEALMPHWPQPTSSPPIDFGATEIQSLWRPLMDDEGWGENLLSAGSLDSAELIGEGRWTFGRRLPGLAHSEVTHITRGVYEGAGALRARVSSIKDDALGGGYAGTVIQIRSPSVRLPAGTAIRIDAMVRTIGFGGPHQGVLVYDSIGGQPMGVLVRGRSDWTPVRLYRQTIQEGEVSVMFELLGGGEATIDEVKLRIWDPAKETDQGILLRPIDTASIDTPQVDTALKNVYTP